MFGILEKPTGDRCNPQNHHLRELLACDRNLSAISFVQPTACCPGLARQCCVGNDRAHRAHTWAGPEGKNWEHLLLSESSQHFVPRSFVPTNKTCSLEHSRVCSLTWKWGRALGPYWVRAGS